MSNPIAKKVLHKRIEDYELVSTLGSGSFGTLFIGKKLQPENVSDKKELAISNILYRDISPKVDRIAVKIEQRQNDENTQLLNEAKVYKMMKAGSSGSFIKIPFKGKYIKFKIRVPNLYLYGNNEDYNIMIIDLLNNGKCSLENLFKKSDNLLSMKTICMIIIQFIKQIEYLHNNKLIHRDIKPENFLLNTSKDYRAIIPSLQNVTYPIYIFNLIDYGLSKLYQKNGKHVMPDKKQKFTGTLRYTSISNHLGIQQSRKDDLEAITYILFYLFCGYLPWQNLQQELDKQTRYELVYQLKTQFRKYVILIDNYFKSPNKHKNILNEILKLKFNARITTYFERFGIDTVSTNGKRPLPYQLFHFSSYVYNLKFSAKPNYKHLIDLLLELIEKEGSQYDFDYDFITTL